jgi:non-specific serine/threonine protein kinase
MSRVAVRTNVSATLSSFIGRAGEMEQLRGALAAHRLVTVVGPGGAGKTRLVREVVIHLIESEGAAAATAAYPDGVWWVELAPVRLGAEVASTVAGMLAVTPSAGRTVTDALADAVRGQRLLIVLDNCEHLLTEVAQLVDSLLRAAPGVKVLCTSREGLSIEGEIAWPIRALRRPAVAKGMSAAELAGFDAVQLFVERAQAVAPHFSLTDANAHAVATICERLDGLPLALELAAAVVPVLGIEALAGRIDDALTLLSRGRRTAVPRHRTLHAVLDWSYTLLDDEQRALLRSLSVFRGSFSLDAMADVCTPTVPAIGFVPALGRLVEHSLIEVLEDDGEARYRLLETVRQFGQALLRGTPEEQEIRRRHAQWVARLTVGAEDALFSGARGRTVQRLRRSIDEIRAALAWAIGPGGSRSVALEIGGALGWFWISGLPWEEARTQVDAILAAADAEGIADADRDLHDKLSLGKLLYPLKGLAFFVGDTDTMLRTGARELPLWESVLATPGLTVAERLAADRGLSLALQLDGIARAMRGEAALAIPSMNRSLEVAARSGDPWIHAVMTIRRALVHFFTGDPQRAWTDYEAAVPTLRDLGELWFLSLAHEGMAMTALALGDPASAARHARESIAVLRPEPDPWFISRGLDTWAFVLVSQADAPDSRPEVLAAATRLLGAAESLRKRCGAGVIGPDLARNGDMTRLLRTRLGDAAYARAHAAGTALTLDDVFAELDSEPMVAVRMSPALPGLPPAAPRPQSRLELRVLGPLAVLRDGVMQAGDALPAGKARELLLFLLINDRVTKDEIGLALWPDASAAQVRNAFHVTLHHLRRQLGPERWITFERNSYRLDRTSAGGSAQLEADVDVLLATSARVRQALRRREPVEPAMLDAARQVFEASGADLAPGFAAGEWIVAEQDRVRTAWADGLDALAQLFRAAQRPDDTIAVCETLVAREPLRESAHRMLMEALALRGERARALAHYERLEAMLEREVGSGSSAETRHMAERLQR